MVFCAKFQKFLFPTYNTQLYIHIAGMYIGTSISEILNLYTFWIQTLIFTQEDFVMHYARRKIKLNLLKIPIIKATFYISKSWSFEPLPSVHPIHFAKKMLASLEFLYYTAFYIFLTVYIRIICKYNSQIVRNIYE